MPAQAESRDDRQPDTAAGVSDGPSRATATQDRIRGAALARFGELGFDGASVRDVARAASVSAGLVIHHFGSKDGLRAAVDASVIARFRSAVAEADEDHRAEGGAEFAAASWGRALGSVILADADLRAYLRRSLLDDAGPGSAVLDHLFAEAERGIDAIERDGTLRADLDRDWLPYQVLFIVLGPLLFEGFMQRRIAKPMFDAAMVDRRSAASHDLLTRGLRRDLRPDMATPTGRATSSGRRDDADRV